LSTIGMPASNDIVGGIVARIHRKLMVPLLVIAATMPLHCG
jgi:hypothetical protein